MHACTRAPAARGGKRTPPTSDRTAAHSPIVCRNESSCCPRTRATRSTHEQASQVSAAVACVDIVLCGDAAAPHASSLVSSATARGARALSAARGATLPRPTADRGSPSDAARPHASNRRLVSSGPRAAARARSSAAHGATLPRPTDDADRRGRTPRYTSRRFVVRHRVPRRRRGVAATPRPR